jgi:thioesterase domain-containing protein
MIYSYLCTHRKPIPPFVQRSDDNWFAGKRYAPQPYPGCVTLFLAAATDNERRVTTDFWNQLAREGLDVKRVPSQHEDVLNEPNVRMLAHAVTGCLANISPPSAPTGATSGCRERDAIKPVGK